MNKFLLPYLFLSITFFVFSSQLTAQVDKNANTELKRKQLKEFIKKHPYSKRDISPDSLKKLSKRDRPDMRAEHDFLMTFDPELGYVPHDRKLKALKETQRRTSSGKNPIPNAEWVERGPDNVGGRTRGLMFDPNDPTNKKVWAGGVTGGLWYNNDITDGTSQWQRVDDFWSNLSITSIAYDPNNTQVFYVGTGEGWFAGAARGAGIWKTTDGGTSWSQLAATTGFYYVNDLVVRNESGTSALYAGVSYSLYEDAWHGPAEGLYRSTDGGSSFTQVLPNVPSETYAYAAADIEIDAANRLWVGTTRVAYSSTQAGGSGGGTVLYSDDGTSWTTSNTFAGGKRVELACAPSDQNYIYAAVEDEAADLLGVYRTTNRGTSWNTLTTPNYLEQSCSYGTDAFTRGQAWYDLILAVHPSDRDAIYAGGIDMNRSIDGGSNWSTLSYWTGACRDEMHADQHAIAFRPGANNEMVFGTDGGVYYSDDAGNTGVASPDFQHRVNAYNVTQFYACAMENTAGSNYFLAGSQDNGSHQFTQAGINSTTEVTGGDGAFCFIDQDDPTYQLTSYVYNNWRRSTNGGASFSNITALNTGRFINPADYDNDADILYAAAGTDEYYRVRGITGAISTATKNANLGGSQASAIIASPYSADVLFIGTDAGEVFKITNANAAGNPTSTQIDGGSLPAGYISCIEIGASDNQLLVTFTSYGVQHVWETTDGGSNWNDKTGNLPDMPVRFALYNPNDRSQVLLATEVGVWSTTDITVASPDWDPTNTGLANVRSDYLQYRDADDMVAIATHGRGLYTSACFAPQMTYVSSTTSQNNTSDVYIGTSNAEIIGIEIETTGANNPLDASSFTFNTTGTTDAAGDITNARVYYTGTSNTFAASNQFGADQANPNGSFTINGTQELSEGTNYFWLTYDINADAAANNFVDAQCTALTVGTAKTPSTTNPAGNREILADPCLVNTYPYTQNFDSWTTSTPAVACTNDGTVSLEECWTNINGDDIDWDIFTGATGSGSTGPSGDHTSGAANYLYTESSGPCTGTGYITSPPFDLSSLADATLSFWYHMYGASMGTMSVQVSTDDGANWSSNLWSLTGDQTDSWFQANIDLSSYAGESRVLIRWTGELDGTDYLSDMAIDDINLDGTAACSYPSSQASNFGASPDINSIDLSWTRGDGNAVLIIAKQGSAVDTDPTDGTNYTANATFASGTEIGTGNFVVYDGIGTSVSVNGLTASTNYHFALYEYNSTGNCYKIPQLTGNSTTNAAITYNWTGNTSDDWFTTSNWSDGTVPNSSSNVTIPDVSPNPFPIINDGIGSVAECNNISIESAASVTINPNGYMTVSGSITNAAGNTGLVINSDASGTGSLIHNTSGGVDATVNIHLASAYRQWHMLGAPVSAATAAVFPVTSNLYAYDESVDDYWTGTNYDSPVNGWTAFTSGNMLVNAGYLFNYYDNTITFTGQLNDNTATGSINIVYTDNGGISPNGTDYNSYDGWNFLSNPYTSAIYWDNAGIDHAAANLDDAVYFYDGSNSQYASWVGGVATNGGTPYIPAGQAYFVKADAAGTLSIPSGAITHDAQSYWKSDTDIQNLVKIRVSSGNYTDETIVRMAESATNGHDPSYDAYKLFSHEENAVQLYTQNEANVEFSINSLPLPGSESLITVPLQIINTEGNFNISIPEHSFNGIDVFLHDKANGSIYEISENKSLSFASTDGNEYNRFELLFEQGASSLQALNKYNVSVYPNPNNGNFYVDVQNSNLEYDITLKNAVGQTVYKSESNKNKTELELNGKAPGIYFISIHFADDTSIKHKVVIK